MSDPAIETMKRISAVSPFNDGVMDIVEQIEIFPRSSIYNSTHALRKKNNEVASGIIRKNGAPQKDITGRRYGSLVIIQKTEERLRHSVVYIAQCDCGQEIKVTKHHVDRMTTHCGCKGVGKAKRPMPGSLGISDKRSLRGTARTTPGRSLFSQYQQSAKKRGINFDISRIDFLDITQCDCYYCGASPSNEKIVGDINFMYNGLDRVDSSKGYSVSNCVPCCKICNIAKNTLSIEEFKEWVNRIYHHWAMIIK